MSNDILKLLLPVFAGFSSTVLFYFLLKISKSSPWKLYRRKKKIREFNNQFIDILATMSNCLKAGLSLVQAIETVEREMDDPVSEEFGTALREHRMGLRIEESLQHLADRMEGRDIQLLVTSISIAHELGANMAEIFDNIANTIRERHRIQERIETLTAQGKMQGLMVSILPIGLGLVLYILAPDMVSLLFTTQMGRFLLVLFAFLEISGWMLIRKMVTINV